MARTDEVTVSVPVQVRFPPIEKVLFPVTLTVTLFSPDAALPVAEAVLIASRVNECAFPIIAPPSVVAAVPLVRIVSATRETPFAFPRFSVPFDVWMVPPIESDAGAVATRAAAAVVTERPAPMVRLLPTPVLANVVAVATVTEPWKSRLYGWAYEVIVVAATVP